MTREESFMKTLFHGVIEDALIFPFPQISEEERDTIRLMLDNVRKFLDEKVDSRAIDRSHSIPSDVLDAMKEMGLFGMIIPSEYGGLGLSNSAYARVMQEIAGIDASIAVTLGAHQSIGLKGILLFGNEAQKKKYLPRLASGRMIAAFALTEPGAGSDAASIATRADLSPDGEGYVLNGSKIWITNGGFADVFTVFARTTAEEGAKPRITAFIVERGHGLATGPSEEKMGIRGSSTTEIFFDDVRVPAGNVLGEAGRGFKVAMEVLNNGRLGLAAGSLGACKRLIAMAVERCRERRAFGRNIGEFGMIKDKISRMITETYALESMTYLTAGLMDSGVGDYSLESAICKVFGSETLWRVVNETLQIAAGIGYMTEYPYERYLRDSRINLIFEGTNEILRAFIALSGVQGPGKQLTEVAKAIREPIKGFGLLSDFAIHRVRSVLGRERMQRMHPSLMKEAVTFSDYTGELNKACDKILRKHGKNVAEMQFAQKRLAELAMDLYGCAATISRTSAAIEKLGEEKSQRQVDMCAAFVGQASQRMASIVRAMEDNDDDLRKRIAAQTYDDGGYPLDVV